jgi:alkyldihydroxyacetonephosphate synthase
MAFGFPGEHGFEAGLEVCRRVLRRGATPAVLRLYDHREAKRSFDVERMALLILLDEGDPAIVEAAMHVAGEEIAIAGATPLEDGLVQRWLDHRNDVSGLEVAVRAGVVVDTVEIAARWSALAEIYQAGCTAVRAVEGTFTVSAHQSHAYPDGACLYFTFAGQPPDGDNDRYYRAVWDAITSVTLGHGGALSHHHGVGINRGRFMEAALGSSYGVLLDIKGTFDPSGILNPGKLGMPSPFGEVAF